jgi:hypothetical protein
MCLTDVEKNELEAEKAAAFETLIAKKKDLVKVKNIRLRLANKTLLRDRFGRDRSGRQQSNGDRSERVQVRAAREQPVASARGNRSGADPWHTPDLLSAEAIAELAKISSGVAAAPTPERLAAITARAHELYNKDLVKVCAVCDQQRFTTDPLPWKGLRHLTMLVTALPSTSSLFLCVTPEMELHPDLRAQYNVSKLVPTAMIQNVDKLLLSPRGMGKDGNVTVCTSCHQSLENQLMPKFAIANG